MKLTELDNLSAEQIKPQRAELAAAIAGEPQEDFAKRYVDRVFDLKSREDKLAEQGKTITLLQQALEKASADHEFTKQSLVQCQAALNAKEKEHNEALSAIATRDSERTQLVQAYEQKLAAETARANAAEASAKASRKGLADVAAVINPLLAAE